MQYHEHIAEEIRTLFIEYRRLYGIEEMYYQVRQHPDPDYMQVTIGLDPSIVGAKANAIEVNVAIRKNNLEYPEQAREHIPKLHQLFITELYRTARAQLIHRDIQA